MSGLWYTAKVGPERNVKLEMAAGVQNPFKQRGIPQEPLLDQVPNGCKSPFCLKARRKQANIDYL